MAARPLTGPFLGVWDGTVIKMAYVLLDEENPMHMEDCNGPEKAQGGMEDVQVSPGAPHCHSVLHNDEVLTLSSTSEPWGHGSRGGLRLSGGPGRRRGERPHARTGKPQRLQRDRGRGAPGARATLLLLVCNELLVHDEADQDDVVAHHRDNLVRLCATTSSEPGISGRTP
jgi:hypothetical protein